MKHRILIARASVILLAALASIAADDKPAEPAPTKFRVLGLFSPDRQDDLREVVKQLPAVKVVSIDFEHAEAVLSYDLEQLFPQAKGKQKFTPEQITQRLDERLRQASRATFGIKPLSTVPRDKLTRVEIAVAGLDCKGCCLAAYESIAKIDGVEQATASFKNGKVNALIDPAKTNRAALQEALKKAQVHIKDKDKKD
jgi:copper chaperone CopZ